MDITNTMIKTLRDKTGAGMMDCKRALEATGGDMEAAIEHLRKKGAAVAAKRADRAAKEGVIVTRVTGDGKVGVMVEVNTETDFVGRSQDFVGFAGTVAATLETGTPSTPEQLLASPTASDKTVGELLNDLLAKVGEKVEIRRFQVLRSDGGMVSAYTHLGAKIGVLVELGGASGEAAGRAGRDLAMQVAAMNPMVISREEVDKGVIERELDIYRTQAKNEGKPAQVVDRIANGKLEKFFQEVCLLEQIYIKDPGKTIREFLQETVPGATVRRFYRFHLGEELRS